MSGPTSFLVFFLYILNISLKYWNDQYIYSLHSYNNQYYESLVLVVSARFTQLAIPLQGIYIIQGKCIVTYVTVDHDLIYLVPISKSTNCFISMFNVFQFFLMKDDFTL